MKNVKYKKRRGVFTILILFSFMLSVLPGGMRDIRAEELIGEEPVEAVELLAEVIWTGIPEEMTIPNTTLKLMSGEDVVESIEVTDGSLEVKFTPVAKFNDAGEEILYSVSQDPLENFTTEIKDFVVENTYVEPIVVAKVLEEPVEEPKAEEPVEEPMEEPKVEEPVVEPKEEEVVEEPLEEPIVEEPVVEAPLVKEGTPAEVTPPVEETPLVEKAPSLSSTPIFDAGGFKPSVEFGIMAEPPTDGIYTPDSGFDMVATDHWSTNNNTLVKYIWIEDGRVFMAISALANIEITNGVPDVTINGVYPTGMTPYPAASSSQTGPPIKIDGTEYPPHRNQAFWTVIYFDNLPPLYDSANTVYVNTDRGGGHEVVGETFNVVRKYFKFVVNKTWSDIHPPTLPPVTFRLTLSGPTVTYTPNPLTGTIDGIAEGIVSGQSQGETAPWQYTWENVPETNAYGAEYTFAVSEDHLTGYTTTEPTGPVISVDGLTYTYGFTNTYINNNVDVTAYKVWDGGLKPTVYFQLWQKIGEVESVVPDLELEEITSIDHEANWEDLPEYSGTTPIIYFVKEVDEAGNDDTPPNYKKSYSEEDRLTITNTYSSPLDDVTATKTWTGGPSEVWYGIDLVLYRTIDWNDGIPVYPEEIEEDPTITQRAGTTNIWDYVWGDLEVTDHDGNNYFYYVVEPVVPDNYDSVADGLAVVNTYSSPLTDIVAKKIWEHGNPSEHVAIDLDLYRGIEGEDPVNLTAEGLVNEPVSELIPGTTTEYRYTWLNLPVNDINGNPYIYTVDEDPVPDGYEKSISTDGLTVTNKAKTSSLQLLKTGKSGKPLEDAEFELYRKVVSTTTDAVPFPTEGGGTIYGIRIEDNTWPGGRLKTDIEGKTSIVLGLEAGDYFVIEVVAPEGYRIHEYPIEFKVLVTTQLNVITITNELAPKIPATGGMGTWLFTLLGFGIMSGALLSFKKHNHNNRGKGENVMKRNRLFTILFTFLLLFVFTVPGMARAEEIVDPPSQELDLPIGEKIGDPLEDLEPDPEEANRTHTIKTSKIRIHKMELFEVKTALPVNHNGKVLTNAELDAALGAGNYVGLPGVTFGYWIVSSSETLATLEAKFINGTLGAPDGTVGPTNALGEVDVTLPDGFYYFRETITPANVSQQIAVPFLLGLPVMNAEGTALLRDTIHIYPKNVTVRGSVELTKLDDCDKVIKGATFKLFKDTDPAVEYIPGEIYTTGSNGKIRVDNLPKGKYYFEEISVPSPWLLNTSKIKFEITKNTNLEVVKVSLKNFKGPEIEKRISSLWYTSASGDFGEKIPFFVTVKLPEDILTYSQLFVTDMIDTKLDYMDNVRVYGSTNGYTWTNLTPVTQYSIVNQPAVGADGLLKVNFVPAAMKSSHGTRFAYVRIVFDASINDTAMMGKCIENRATVTFNNGYLLVNKDIESNKVCAYTSGAKFKKWDGQVGLAGAEFAVKNSQGKFLKLEDGKYSWVNSLADTTFRVVSDANGYFEIKGLGYNLWWGTEYWLVETKAPMGPAGSPPYNIIETPIKFVVNGSSYYTHNPYRILNKLGPKIPQTGGIGTAVFSVIGAGLMGSALLLNKKKRR